MLDIPGFGPIEATILDVSNPMVLVRAEDIGLTGRELPEEVNSNKAASEILEKIRGAACCKMGFAKDLEDAIFNSPAVPKVGFFHKATELCGYCRTAGKCRGYGRLRPCDLCI